MGLGEKSKTDFVHDYRLKKHLPKRFRAKKFMRNLIDAYSLFNSDTDFRSHQLLPAVENTIETWVNLYKQVAENKDNWHINNNTDALNEEHLNYYNLVESHYLNNLPKLMKQYERLKTLL
jgi:hypothetical protein